MATTSVTAFRNALNDLVADTVHSVKNPGSALVARRNGRAKNNAFPREVRFPNGMVQVAHDAEEYLDLLEALDVAQRRAAAAGQAPAPRASAPPAPPAPPATRAPAPSAPPVRSFAEGVSLEKTAKSLSSGMGGGRTAPASGLSPRQERNAELEARRQALVKASNTRAKDPYWQVGKALGGVETLAPGKTYDELAVAAATASARGMTTYQYVLRVHHGMTADEFQALHDELASKGLLWREVIGEGEEARGKNLKLAGVLEAMQIGESHGLTLGALSQRSANQLSGVRPPSTKSSSGRHSQQNPYSYLSRSARKNGGPEWSRAYNNPNYTPIPSDWPPEAFQYAPAPIVAGETSDVTYGYQQFYRANPGRPGHRTSTVPLNVPHFFDMPTNAGPYHPSMYPMFGVGGRPAAYAPAAAKMNRGERGGFVPGERESLPASAFLKPETRSWPIREAGGGHHHAIIALQYMSRGFGDRSEYPMLVQRMARLLPPRDRRFSDVWSYYRQHKAGIEAKHGGPMPELSELGG
jgi:hypothetical protein